MKHGRDPAHRRKPQPASAPGAMPPASIAARAGRDRAGWAALIVLAGALTYANSLQNPFVIDDQRALVENASIRTLTPLSVPLSPPPESPVARRPLVNLTFAIDYAVAGLDLRWLRLSNLAVHLLAALVLFGLVRRTLLLDALAPSFGRDSTALAGVCALLWALHPLQSEVVNYLSQRTTSLKALCYLLTLYCALRAVSRPPGRWAAAAVGACAAGMACKESMATAPLVLVLFDRAFVFGTFGAAFRARRTFYAAVASSWIVLAALMATGGRTTVGFDAGMSPWSYLLNQAPLLLDYLRLAVWPRAMVVDYGMPQPLALSDVLIPVVVVAALGIAASVALVRRSRAGFLAAAFFVLLAPTSSIVPIVSEVGAERRMYLPLAAVVVLLVCGGYSAVSAALASVSARRGREVPHRIASRTAAVVAAVVAALLATGTVLRNREYASPLTLAQTVVERRPHGRAYFALGHALFREGQRTEAIAYFRQSAEDFAPARFALGSELLADGDLEEGIRELRAFTKLMPLHAAVPSARQMIAAGLAALGDSEAAMTELREALRFEPDAPRAHALLGQLLLARGQAEAAVPHLQRAAAAQPDEPSTLRMLASALASAGDSNRTIAVLQRGIVLHPRDAVMRDQLGIALARAGRLEDALGHFRAAAALDPAYHRARQNVARAEQQLASASRP